MDLDPSPRRVLVLGGSGQLGSRIAADLRAEGHAVVATSRRAGAPGLTRFDPFVGDWSSLGRFDAAVNAVGAIEETAEATFERVHVALAEQLVAAHDSLGAPLLFHLSALGAREDHRSRFLATKAAGERLLREALDGAVVVLRPSIVLTPGTRLLCRLALAAAVARCTRGILPIPRAVLATRIQPILGEDLMALVAALVRGDQPPAAVIEAGGADVFSVARLLELALAARGLHRRFLPLPLRLVRFALALQPRRARLVSLQELTLLLEDNLVGTDPAAEVFRGHPTESWLRAALG